MSYSDIKEVLKEVQRGVEFGATDEISINQKGIFGNTPLIVFTYWQDSDAIRLLINEGADVNAVGEDSETALHIAVVVNNINIAKILLDLGASIDIPNIDGLNPLDIARNRNNEHMVKVLLGG